MKHLIFKFSVIGIFVACLFSNAFGQAKKVEPMVKEAIKQIFLNGDVLLSAAKDCQSMKTSDADKTILDFLSGVLSFQTEPNTKNAVEFSFKQGRGKEIIWICDVLFRSGDDESPASNGIRFTMRNSDRKLMRDSLMCIGTG